MSETRLLVQHGAQWKVGGWGADKKEVFTPAKSQEHY